MLSPKTLIKEGYELNQDFYNPTTGEPWCRFGRGLFCMNGWRCKNPNHRKYEQGDIDQN